MDVYISFLRKKLKFIGESGRIASVRGEKESSMAAAALVSGEIGVIQADSDGSILADLGFVDKMKTASEKNLLRKILKSGEAQGKIRNPGRLPRDTASRILRKRPRCRLKVWRSSRGLRIR